MAFRFFPIPALPAAPDPHVAGREAQVRHVRRQQARGLVVLHTDLDRIYWQAYREATEARRRQRLALFFDLSAPLRAEGVL